MLSDSVSETTFSALTRRMLFFACLVGVATCSLTTCSLTTAQQPVVEDEEDEVVPMQQFGFVMPEENFEQWIFQRHGNAAQARVALKSTLQMQIDAVDRDCQLTDAQKQRLLLAGKGDMSRFFDRVEQVRKKFRAVKNDQQKFNEIWQHIQPLQMEIQSGLFGVDSLFHRSIRPCLDTEQAEKFTKVDGERRTFRHRAKIELAVAMIEKGVPLRNEQREQLTKILVDETQPPRRSGQYDYYYVLLQASRLAEDKLKPIFDNGQWKRMQQYLAQGRGLEQFLKQNGVLAQDGDDE